MYHVKSDRGVEENMWKKRESWRKLKTTGLKPGVTHWYASATMHLIETS